MITQQTPTAITSPFMTLAEVMALTHAARTTIYAWVARGDFPAPASLGRLRSNGRSSTAAWVRAEVDARVEEQIAKPRAVGPKAQTVMGQPA